MRQIKQAATTISRESLPALDPRGVFLPINSTMQSTFSASRNSESRRRQAAALLLYAIAVLGLMSLSTLVSLTDPLTAILLGLTFPGAGFLHWTSDTQVVLAAGLFGLSFCIFILALTLWFATGNVLAPVGAWIALAAIAAFPESFGLSPTPGGSALPWLIGSAALTGSFSLWLRGRATSERNHQGAFCTTEASPREIAPQEINAPDNARVRLLLDRALQPVAEFNGFEWRDQFQTAAVRYQVNFMAYALAVARQHHAPASRAHYSEAQERLLGKIADHRLWRYWQLENLWGNLRLDRDPVPHQNIMYSGFTLLQMALGNGGVLDLAKAGKPWRSYGMDAIAEVLERQFRTSRYGLLACEPNWIYPLCNLITMAGIKASDARLGTDRWNALSEPFLAALDREATRKDGSFIAFRSSLTGIAPLAPGGIVMQAFPCLFLNALAPDRAQEHWHRVRRKLDNGSWGRLFWPIDTGNYGFSRASSYAATAAAAVEMGDQEVVGECLRRLEIECPAQHVDGATHRTNASLWAHALEVFARANRKDGLRDLVTRAPRECGPYLASAPYPDVQILHAASDCNGMDLTIAPGRDVTEATIEIGGLLAQRQYATGLSTRRFMAADGIGTIRLTLPLSERLCLHIRPAF